jgi:hypothetical protein
MILHFLNMNITRNNFSKTISENTERNKETVESK